MNASSAETEPNPTAFASGSLVSSYSDINSGQYVDEVRTLAFGLKIQYAFPF
ncbi:hypothetical protein [Autumnicola musiva]|uniref:Uncharacterized protein n=1 Tax=Autumnicola musiva TaxID=3075589 RepID=A0ABU3D574_9FLAO|nr:hypothetical protein [Zunongwangia sp. F117]MDT0676551.1 hypothetical protein [Zunongwangia sp. F117]